MTGPYDTGLVDLQALVGYERSEVVSRLGEYIVAGVLVGFTAPPQRAMFHCRATELGLGNRYRSVLDILTLAALKLKENGMKI